jgi:Cys-tRNA(Pro)/Cys-tRNA(Cys) deacylase
MNMVVYDFVLNLLEQSGVNYKIHEHAPSVTYQDAADYLDFPLDRLLKAIAFRVKNGAYVLAAVNGKDRVDYKKLAQHLGTSRDKLVRLAPEEVEASLGYPLGGVAPIPTNAETKVVFDSRTLTLGKVFCGTGRNDRTLEIAITDLVKISGGSVALIVQEAGESAT